MRHATRVGHELMKVLVPDRQWVEVGGGVTQKDERFGEAGEELRLDPGRGHHYVSAEGRTLLRKLV